MTNTNKEGIVERIIGPAIRKDGFVWWSSLPRASHYSVSEMMKRNHIETPLLRSESGFVTDAGRFVDRRTAWMIAEAQGQIVRVFGGTKDLFSECLWTDEPDTPPADPPAEGKGEGWHGEAVNCGIPCEHCGGTDYVCAEYIASSTPAPPNGRDDR